jgi:hypothetical protein
MDLVRLLDGPKHNISAAYMTSGGATTSTNVSRLELDPWLHGFRCVLPVTHRERTIAKANVEPLIKSLLDRRKQLHDAWQHSAMAQSLESDTQASDAYPYST